jgi:tRNA-dihydrouridine synthase
LYFHARIAGLIAMIYLAPLQGFTDYIYRKVYSTVFNEIDCYYVPYIGLKNGEMPVKYRKEILPENNTQEKVVPQILVKDEKETQKLSQILEEQGYSEINLNLGCPYPMVSKRGRGAGLLPFPYRINEILDAFYKHSSLKFSVKLRAGMHTEEEIRQVIPVLNAYPLQEVILHPRIARQLYAGEIKTEAFQYAYENIKHPLVFNGDVFSVNDFEQRSAQFPKVKAFMLGRGVLMNPFLPMEIKQQVLPESEKWDSLVKFHDAMLENYMLAMDNEGNALNKMQQFWIYFSHNFNESAKALKRIKKCKNMNKYKATVKELFAQL